MRPNEDKVKTKKKTYAEMVKEDKAKGKAKILALRVKDKKEDKKPGDKEKKAKGVSFFKNLATTLKNKGKASANEMKMAGPSKSASSVKVTFSTSPKSTWAEVIPSSLCKVEVKKLDKASIFLSGLYALIRMASGDTPHSANVLPSLAYISLQSKV